MKTTKRQSERESETERRQMPMTDYYGVLGVDFALTTDNDSVREFLRAAYRRFLRTAIGNDLLEMTAILGPDVDKPFVQAASARLELAERPMPENRAFLFLLNALMDRVSDYLVIHGAAFSIGDRGFILAGPPTAGKSTLALELSSKGA